MQFQQADYAIPAPSIDLGINLGPVQGGELFRPAGAINAPERPPSVYETGAEYIRKSRAVNEAVAQQRRIDNIYERVVGTAPPREVEVLPPDDPREVFTRPTMKSARPPDAMPVDVSSVYNRPSTPNTSGARRAVTVDVIPTSAELVQPPLLNDPTPGAKPAGIASPLGRYGMPLAGLAVDTTFRLAAGQPIQQAVGASAASSVGGLVGATLGTAVAGPIGGFLGGMFGGYVAGRIADFAFGLMRPASADDPQPNRVKAGFDPLGLKPGYYYTIVVEVSGFGYSVTRTVGTSIAPITNLRFDKPPNDRNGYVRWSSWDKAENEFVIVGYGSTGFGGRITNQSFHQQPTAPIPNVPDVSPPLDNRPVQFASHPLNVEASVPSATLGARDNVYVTRDGKTVKVSTLDNYIPPSLSPRTNGILRGDSPYWIRPAQPNNKPSPEHSPSNLGGDLPIAQTSDGPANNPNVAPLNNGLSAPNLTKPEAKNQTIPNKNSPPTRRGIPSPTGTFTQYGTPITIVPSATPNLTKVAPQPIIITRPSSTKPIIITNTIDATAIIGEMMADFTKISTTTTEIQRNQIETSTKLDKLMDVLKCLDLFENPNLCDKLKEMTQSNDNTQIQWQSINVPSVLCVRQEDGTYQPQRSETAIQVLATATGSEILQVAKQFEEQAKIAESACLARNHPQQQTPNVTLAVPEHWRIRPDTKRPQLLVIYAARNLNNKQWGESRWSMSIPHPNYRAQQLKRLKFLPREQGIHGAWAVLTDESLVRVYMSNEDKAIRYVADLIRRYVDRTFCPSLNPLDFIQTGRRPGIEKQMVYPFKAELHLEGIVRGKPDDEYYFP